MGSPQVRKFLFERSFADDAEHPEAEAAQPKPIYTADQLEAAKREAYEQGFAAGREAMAQETQRKDGLTQEKIGEELTRLFEAGAAAFQDQNATIEQIALTVAQKLLPAYAEKYGLEEIRTLLEKIIHDLGREPRVVLRVAESQIEATEAMLKEITAQQAYAGHVLTIAEPGYGPSDCRIEWADGGIERDQKDLWQRLDAIMEKNYPNLQRPAAPETGDNT